MAGRDELAVHSPVWVDGRLGAFPAPAKAIRRPGPGVFETLRFERGALFFVEPHLSRMQRGAERLGIPWPPPWDPRAALGELAAALELPEAALRLTLTLDRAGGPVTLSAVARPIEPRPAAGVSVRSVSFRARSAGRLAGIKTTRREPYDRARAAARAAGAREALLVGRDGELIEGAISNLFLVRGGELCTPPLASGCLPGIVRAALLTELERAPLSWPVIERRLTLTDLQLADEVFLTNSLVRSMAVVEVLGLKRPAAGLPGEAGAVARSVRDRLLELEAEQRWTVRRPPG